MRPLLSRYSTEVDDLCVYYRSQLSARSYGVDYEHSICAIRMLCFNPRREEKPWRISHSMK